MDQAPVRRGHERRRDLRGDFQRGGHVKRAVAAHAGFERFALDQFHRVVTAAGLRGGAEVENPRDVRMTQGRRRARLAQKTFAQGRAQIAAARRVAPSWMTFSATGRCSTSVHGAVGHAHRPPAQFPERAVLPARDLEVAIHRGIGASGRQGGCLCGIIDGFLHQAATQQAGQAAAVRTHRGVTLCAHRTRF